MQPGAPGTVPGAVPVMGAPGAMGGMVPPNGLVPGFPVIPYTPGDPSKGKINFFEFTA